MATLTMPGYQFKVVTEEVMRVDAGLTFSLKMSRFVQALFSLILLTGAFKVAVKQQASLVLSLQSARMQDLSSAEYATLATQIESLVATNERMVARAKSVGFRPWDSSLEEFADQAAHLDSIAESFRMACDEDSLFILAEAAREVDSAYSVQAERLVDAVHS